MMIKPDLTVDMTRDGKSRDWWKRTLLRIMQSKDAVVQVECRRAWRSIFLPKLATIHRCVLLGWPC
jgi:hypothetical protein